MRILVTGGAGFIGSHVADAYIDAGHEVTIVDDLSNGNKKQVNPKAAFTMIDVRDPNIATLFEKSKFDVVNHHAAQIDVRRSVQDPFLDASINILGALRLLDCCRSFGVKKFIFASSGGTVYGECPKAPATEDQPINPESPYGFSKAAAETYVRFYGKQHKVPYTILRYANVYGPRQDPQGEAGVVAIFAGKLLEGSVTTIYGDGKQERDYVHVQDIAAANVAALERGANETFNIGSGIPTTVNALFEKLTKASGEKQKAATFAPKRDGELHRSVLNSDRAGKTLGWKPSFDLDKGLFQTLEYFRSHAVPAGSKSSSHEAKKSR
jgi:UDP-glucose 4-epimerase